MRFASVAWADFEPPFQNWSVLGRLGDHSMVSPSVRVLLRLDPEDCRALLMLPAATFSFSFDPSGRSGRKVGGGEGRLCHSSSADLGSVITIQ